MTKETIITTAPPFPSTHWWQQIIQKQIVVLNKAEIYQKSKPKNRYTLTGSQGKQLLSIPLEGGRNQRIKIGDIKISYADDWQKHHWKTIKTLYQRAPFFEYYAEDIEKLFQEKTEKLFDWNRNSIAAIIKILKLNIKLETKVCENPESGMTAPTLLSNTLYHQVFQEKTGFQANCSILDLIFCEGNQSLEILKASL